MAEGARIEGKARINNTSRLIARFIDCRARCISYFAAMERSKGDERFVGRNITRNGVNSANLFKDALNVNQKI